MALLLALLFFITLFTTSRGRAAQYQDPFCALTGLPARDPADTTAKYLRSQEQKCLLTVPSKNGTGNSVQAKLHYVACGGLLTYQTQLFTKPTPITPKLDSTYCQWRIDRGVVRITSANLDMGTSITPAGATYALSLDDSPTTPAVPGMVLGMSLGGSGTAAQNLFPQSSASQSGFQTLEKAVYNCLKSNPLTSATIRWDFNYRTSTSSRPYSVVVRIEYSEPNGALSACGSGVQQQTFDN